ncbi:hypothetical protein, partial [Legionella feeleii]|uniref:hypothetical protein n=2 Tax=Legionella feeleii TaxID=453 RepID=UPI001EE6C8B1
MNMTLDVNLYIEQASIYLSNILNINLLLFTASALLFTLGYQKKLNLCWWLVNAGEIALGVWAITIIIRAHRGLSYCQFWCMSKISSSGLPVRLFNNLHSVFK